jgi:hypothetical protein
VSHGQCRATSLAHIAQGLHRKILDYLLSELMTSVTAFKKRDSIA